MSSRLQRLARRQRHTRVLSCGRRGDNTKENHMAMESLGGNMPAGRPVAVFAGGKTHVFAIGAGGGMNPGTASNGIDWSGPSVLPPGGANLEPCYPGAIAVGNSAHVFALNHASFLARGGPLVHWFSPDGNAFLPPMILNN